MMKRFDPITLEVIRNRLDGIAAEIQATLLRSAYSVILKEGEDCSAALFNARGDVLAQSVALPQHMAAFIPAMARLLEAFPASACREGDVYAMNDPHDGGTHLPDLVVAVPVLAAGRTVGFSVCLAHQEDFGGKVPGSMPTDATEIFQEGLILPPLRLYDAGVLNETLIGIIRRNVRLPRVVIGDISAQVAAATVGRDRLQALFEEYGVATDDYLDGCSTTRSDSPAPASRRSPMGSGGSRTTWTTTASRSTAVCRSPQRSGSRAIPSPSTSPARVPRWRAPSTLRGPAAPARPTSRCAASPIRPSPTTRDAIGRSTSSFRRGHSSILAIRRRSRFAPTP